ncbi:MAG: dihydroneopterin aldolase [Lentisphaeria bacterium]|nr:dihydroneopterin aldolase [Lentisphaeria bacterium]
MDTIFIRDLALECIIGTLEHERHEKQELLLNISFSGDFREAGKRDDLNCSVNYREVENLVISFVENSSFLLLEALAENLAEKILAFERVQEVSITIDKKKAALKAKSIALSITRNKI